MSDPAGREALRSRWTPNLAEILMIASEQQRAPQEPSSVAIAAIHKDGVKLNRWWRRRPSPWLITLPARATCQPGNRVPCLGDWGAGIALDLVSGRGEDYWPRPGRIFAAARSHRFSELADAIDTAFARWDRAHLHEFVVADGRRIGQPEFDEFDQGIIDGDRTRLSKLNLGEQFLYEFDLGDSWLHLCPVRPARIDPATQLGIVPAEPLPYWGWGTIPDQYGRRWAEDDGEPTAVTNVNTATARNQPAVGPRIDDSPLPDVVPALLIGVGESLEWWQICRAFGRATGTLGQQRMHRKRWERPGRARES